MARGYDPVFKCRDSEECVVCEGHSEYLDEVCEDSGAVCWGYYYGVGVCAVSGYAYVIFLLFESCLRIK